MANDSKTDALIDRLHADGIRKRVATVIAGGRGGAKKGEKQARQLLDQLEDATAAIRTEVLGLGSTSKRSAAAKKAAATRKKNAAKRSASAKKGAATRSASAKKGATTRSASAKKGATTRAKSKTAKTTKAKAKR